MREKAPLKRAAAGVPSLTFAARFSSFLWFPVRRDEGFEGKVPVLHAKGCEAEMPILPLGPPLMDKILCLRTVIKFKGAPKAGLIIQEGKAPYGTQVHEDHFFPLDGRGKDFDLRCLPSFIGCKISLIGLPLPAVKASRAGAKGKIGMVVPIDQVVPRLVSCLGKLEIS